MTKVYACEFRKAQATVDRCIKCPDKAAIAMTLIWLYWSRKPEIAMEQHIRFGIKHARAGRDLPGVQNSKFRDIWDNANNLGDLHWDSEEALNTRRFGKRGSAARSEDVFDVAANWGGGGMDNLPDPGPGPAKLVEDAEAYQVLRGILTDKEAKANDLYIAGLKNMEVAEELEVTQGRATQLRTQTAAKWKRLCE